jgi:hypothetical protein
MSAYHKDVKEQQGPCKLYVTKDVLKNFNKGKPKAYKNISNEIIENFISEECDIQLAMYNGFRSWNGYTKFGIQREIIQRVYNRCYNHTKKENNETN